MKVILCGYNWIGCKVLDLLIENGNEVFVFTHESPHYVNNLIEYCNKVGVNYSTDKINKNNLPFIPNIISSIYYRYIIPNDVIEICKGRIFNLHPSLLPNYRGCSSLTWAMINGERYVGYTYHYLTNKVDCGNIIIQNPIKIEDFDTQVSLYYRVMFEAVKDYMKTLHLVDEGYIGHAQNIEIGEYYKRGAPNNGCIDVGWDDARVERFIRAMIFPPMPLATFKGEPLHSFDQFMKSKEMK